MIYVDSHIHFQDYKTEDVKNVVKNAFKKNVCHFVNVSTSPKDWPSTAHLCNEYTEITPAFGVHPWYIEKLPSNWLQILEEILCLHPNAWVGECGIDLYKNKDSEMQKKFFLPQIELARKYHRPLIIHAVKAHEMMYSLFPLLPKKSIFHSFTGSAQWGTEIQKRGFYLGINFSLLRRKNFSDIIRNIDINSVLLETDGPYQALIKGDVSRPEELPLLAQKIAQVKNLSLEEIQKQLYLNWQRFIEG